ncbi:MAG TPA: nucleotidyltransferase domain-containing protein [archaeon]|nr:nucleotidyltransferase domain-containing protein [archaeon]
MHPEAVESLKEISEDLLKEFPGAIKAIWVYGSAARGTAKPTSDIDMMVLLDDVQKEISSGIIEMIDGRLLELTKKMQKEKKVNFHAQAPKKLSDWWDLLRSGEPWVFTSMRDAIPIYDPSGYIEPIQRLLSAGRMHGTWERSHMLIERAPFRLQSARKIFIEEITADLLSAMVDSSHAVLMYAGTAPPSAPQIGAEMRRQFCEKNLLEPGFPELYEDFFETVKKIEHGEMTKVSGKELDKWIGRTKAFIIRMEGLFAVLETEKKKELIEEAYKESTEACSSALGKLGVSVEEEKEILKFVESHLIKPGHVSKAYMEILKKIFSMKDALESGKLSELSEKDIYSSHMYAKNLHSALDEIKIKPRDKHGKQR